MLTQTASAAGQLATGTSPSEQRARAVLAQAQTKADQLASTASAKLKPTNPARPLIVHSASEAAATAGRLRTMKVTSQARSRLHKTQANLSMLASEVGLVQTAPGKATVTQITSTLKNLEHQAVGTGSSS